MNPATRNLLLGLYAEWRRLSDLEGAAIREGDWSGVEQQQLSKQTLRDQIVRTIQRWNTEQEGSEAARSRFETEFRPIVSGLIEQETLNQTLLQEQRQHLDHRLATARQSSSRLRGIQRSYGADAESSSRWQSYS